jgi:predicted ATPase
VTSGRAVAALVASLLVAALGLGSTVVAFRSKAQAHSSLEQALDLREARLQVARAQRALGSSDIEDAARSGARANEVALRVGEQTDRIAALLRPLRAAAVRTTSAGRRGIRGTVATRRQTEVAADVLEALAAYQHEASANATATNRALKRILAALRKTNREFP